MTQSHELITNIRGRDGASNVCFHACHRQAVNFFEMCIDFGAVKVGPFKNSALPMDGLLQHYDTNFSGYDHAY